MIDEMMKKYCDQKILKSENKKIMPGIGCMDRRMYVEDVLAKKHSLLDPCLLCENRGECIKPVVVFS